MMATPTEHASSFGVRSAVPASLRRRARSNEQVMVQAEPARAFAPIQRIGGPQGWYFVTWLWYLRGSVDLLVGGSGCGRDAGTRWS